MEELGFPAWIRISHVLTIIWMSFLIRSGLQILASHPKLYFNDACRQGSEWLRITSKEMPRDKLWTSMDEEEDFSPWVAQPGGDNLGLGRQWHFLNVIFFILTGVVYVALLFLTGEWHRFFPYSWAEFPQVYRDMVTYLSFDLPPLLVGQPYNALQKFTYGAVIFFLAPLSIATGALMSPALSARYPWIIKVFGGHQAARSVHFLSMVAFTVFIVIHVAMVIFHGFGKETAKMIFGSIENATIAATITLIFLGVLFVLHVFTTRFSLRSPRSTQLALLGVVGPVRRTLLRRLTSAQDYPASDVSPQPRVNGRPPVDEEYKRMAENGFEGYELEVCGLVEKPRRFTMQELRTFPTWQRQTTLHHCIQGWSYVAEWGGVPVRQILELCGPKPEARYLVFHTMQNVEESEPEPKGPGYFYGTIDFELAYHPQTILALEMNGERLPVEHGAPVRLRVETQLGFKMVKWIRAIEVVESYEDIGEGYGGWREDNQYYGTGAGI